MVFKHSAIWRSVGQKTFLPVSEYTRAHQEEPKNFQTQILVCEMMILIDDLTGHHGASFLLNTQGWGRIQEESRAGDHLLTGWFCLPGWLLSFLRLLSKGSLLWPWAAPSCHVSHVADPCSALGSSALPCAPCCVGSFDQACNLHNLSLGGSSDPEIWNTGISHFDMMQHKQGYYLLFMKPAAVGSFSGGKNFIFCQCLTAKPIGL